MKLDELHGDDLACAAIARGINDPPFSPPDILDLFIIGNLNSKGVNAPTFGIEWRESDVAG
jgi:hypothetical protein